MKHIIIIAGLLSILGATSARALDELDARLAVLQAENAALKKLQKIEALERENAVLRKQVVSSPAFGGAVALHAAPVPPQAALRPVTEGYTDFSAQRRPTPAAPVPAYAKAPAYVSAVPLLAADRWAGGYVGGHAGMGIGEWPYRMHSSSSYSGTSYVPNAVCCGGTYVPYMQTTTTDSSVTSGPLGAIIGVQGGYRWQFGSFVFGPEFDLSASTTKQTRSQPMTYISTYSPPVQPPQQQAYQGVLASSLDWASTLRANVGYAAGDWLLFATGGFAIAGVDVQSSWTNGNRSIYPIGYTVGGGAEWAVGTNLSLRFEYLYLGLQKTTWTDQSTTMGNASTTYEISPSTHVVRAGVNWNFH